VPRGENNEFIEPIQLLEWGLLNCFEELTSVNWHLNVGIASCRLVIMCKEQTYDQWDCSNRWLELLLKVTSMN
jgi:hypothetical protein